MKLSKRWVITTLITFVVFFIPTVAFLFQQKYSLFRGNTYMAEHAARYLTHDVYNAFFLSIRATIIPGQIIFWLIELLRKAGVVNYDTNTKAQFFVIPIITFSITFALLVITMPLWFRLSF